MYSLYIAGEFSLPLLNGDTTMPKTDEIEDDDVEEEDELLEKEEDELLEEEDLLEDEDSKKPQPS
jgi:hypothetical protein